MMNIYSFGVENFMALNEQAIMILMNYESMLWIDNGKYITRLESVKSLELLWYFEYWKYKKILSYGI